MSRHTLTARAVEREYGIGRTLVGAAVRSGELPASRIGARDFTILRTDVEAWLRRHAVRPTAHADAIVERVLARESRRAGAG